ncbi:LuxR C-terminal-related transcriptional regulator [Paenibacillus sediminis]|uniref:DNA-binding NarL/FixJ family response regulator n=1 Tax=Paenibacillus sediminis TaxID=664909 RepID=A0ABS4GY89_9BACL|nr:LuxR C-terminal-related transcriptional regulator [Paenibacillus sediminis]MBP1935235.1 DNA-binding NarL/FixJ family response regulator [Paenibacillus sediminis]
MKVKTIKFVHLLIPISGFIPKTATREKLITAIRCALNGETIISTSLIKTLRRQIIFEHVSEIGNQKNSISKKELTILKNLAQGKSNKEIAETLLISQRTLEYALTRI